MHRPAPLAAAHHRGASWCLQEACSSPETAQLILLGVARAAEHQVVLSCRSRALNRTAVQMGRSQGGVPAKRSRPPRCTARWRASPGLQGAFQPGHSPRPILPDRTSRLRGLSSAAQTQYQPSVSSSWGPTPPAWAAGCSGCWPCCAAGDGIAMSLTHRTMDLPAGASCSSTLLSAGRCPSFISRSYLQQAQGGQLAPARFWTAHRGLGAGSLQLLQCKLPAI